MSLQEFCYCLHPKFDSDLSGDMVTAIDDSLFRVFGQHWKDLEEYNDQKERAERIGSLQKSIKNKEEALKRRMERVRR